MGAALGGPIAVGGKLITRAQVGGMVKRLAAKGISSEGMSPSQIVRTNWALELKAAGKEAEGRMLREMVEGEMKGAEAESLEAKIGKDSATGGKQVEAATTTETGVPERGLQGDRLGKRRILVARRAVPTTQGAKGGFNLSGFAVTIVERGYGLFMT